MLKKKFAFGGLVIATAAGAILTASPANASFGPGGWGGWGGGGGWFSGQNFRHFSNHRNLNFNGNSVWNYIRLRVHNRNNNVAVARNDQAQAQRENQFQLERQRQNERQRQDQIDQQRDRRDGERGPGVGAPIV
ncbi:hypothetical protein [Actinoallomurus rhizosphaericola]|uniref:hypothetical protein n=1 Tax=Actinoallomurus rhizosphaericola TaxID=2952536 RepID=UPI002093FF66|nr:hypothetical protein [Actinoallomurus rhizosphaericola]MCO5996211.1 hypothetical protein [Actinoallomurus rhizosphaericola]